MLKQQSTFALAITVIYVAVVAMYFGAAWNPTWRMSHLQVGIVNNDRGTSKSIQNINNDFGLTVLSAPGNLVGNLINTTLASLNSDYNITYVELTTEMIADRTAAQIADDGDFWAILEITPNFTLNMNASVFGGIRPYSQRINLYFDEGRMQATISTIRSITGGILRGLSMQVAAINFAKSGFIPIKANQTDPIALANPLLVQEYNLHPVPAFGMGFAAFFGTILLFSASMMVAAPSVKSMRHMEKKVHRWQLIGTTLLFLLFMSLLVPIIVALAVTSFGSTPAKPWIAYYFFLVLLYFANAVFITGFASLVGTKKVPIMFLLLLLGLLSSQGFVAMEQQHGFFRIGWGMILFHGVMGARYLLFGSYGKWMGLHIGVMCAYLGVGLIMLIASAIKSEYYPTPKKEKKSKEPEHKSPDSSSTEMVSTESSEVLTV
jgi:hypothetical protein